MTRTPSKHTPLARLRVIQADHGQAVNGTEYAPDELETEIHAKEQRKADDFDFEAVQVEMVKARVRRTRKKQTTRLYRAHCPDCGFVCRVTRLWIEKIGAPLCACSMVPLEISK